MNWNKIKEKYPKAWGLLIGFIGENHIESFQYLTILFRPFLYDFFDEQGIYINVNWRNYYDTNHNHRTFFDWEVYTEDISGYSSEVEEPTRTEAEEKAFEKAFEILEGKL